MCFRFRQWWHRWHPKPIKPIKYIRLSTYHFSLYSSSPQRFSSSTKSLPTSLVIWIQLIESTHRANSNDDFFDRFLRFVFFFFISKLLLKSTVNDFFWAKLFHSLRSVWVRKRRAKNLIIIYLYKFVYLYISKTYVDINRLHLVF